MAFRFPLASVLRVRESIEKREERALLSSQSKRTRLVRQIEEVEVRLAEEAKSRDYALRQSLPAGHLHAMLLDEAADSLAKRGLVEMLQELEKRQEKLKSAYLLAHRECETIKNIENTQRNVFQDKQMRLEQKSLDDILIARYRRADRS
jgi:flagellar biosynthesis chaperone FliJ